MQDEKKTWYNLPENWSSGQIAHHCEICDDVDCGWCDYWLEFYMCCDRCGHVGQVDADGWVLGPFNEYGAAEVFCSEQCRDGKI